MHPWIWRSLAMAIALAASLLRTEASPSIGVDGGLFSGQGTPLFGNANAPLIVARAGATSSGASLFADRDAGGMFEIRVTPPASQRLSLDGSYPPGLQGLRELIGRAEAGRRGYDAVQYGAKIKPKKPPTQMTMAEIYAWIDATPGQPHAIGLYQFIPKTLRRVAQQAGIPANARISPDVQDRMGDILFGDAGYNAFVTGKLSRTKFMNNLAKIWAGFPNSTGKSHYHGYAGNYATISWAEFNTVIAQIFPHL